MFVKPSKIHCNKSTIKQKPLVNLLKYKRTEKLKYSERK